MLRRECSWINTHQGTLDRKKAYIIPSGKTMRIVHLEQKSKAPGNGGEPKVLAGWGGRATGDTETETRLDNTRCYGGGGLQTTWKLTLGSKRKDGTKINKTMGNPNCYPSPLDSTGDPTQGLCERPTLGPHSQGMRKFYMEEDLHNSFFFSSLSL